MDFDKGFEDLFFDMTYPIFIYLDTVETIFEMFMLFSRWLISSLIDFGKFVNSLF